MHDCHCVQFKYAGLAGAAAVILRDADYVDYYLPQWIEISTAETVGEGETLPIPNYTINHY